MGLKLSKELLTLPNIWGREEVMVCSVTVYADNVEIPEMMGKARNTGRVGECLQAREGEEKTTFHDLIVTQYNRSHDLLDLARWQFTRHDSCDSSNGLKPFEILVRTKSVV